MILYRIETEGETKAFEYHPTQGDVLAQGKAYAEAGIGCQAQKIDVPTKKERFVEFLNYADATAGNLAELDFDVTVIKKFEAKT